MSIKLLPRRISLKQLIGISGITHDSTGVCYNTRFTLIYPGMTIIVYQNTSLDKSWEMPEEIARVYNKISRYLRWRRIFPAYVTLNGLYINCYQPLHRKNG